LHPKDFFVENPFRPDKIVPQYREHSSKKEKLKPFVPSKPAKLVILGTHA
jgi:hypothetical protein